MCSFKRLFCACCFTFLTLGLVFPSTLRAQVINEIMYSPQSKAWIEIYNNTDSSIDLSTYKILDAGASSSGHSINSPAILPAHSYAVLGTSGAISNFGSVAWLLFQSALKPTTSGDTFTLKDASKNTISTKIFSASDGANGDGSSLQRQADGTWLAGLPTPGAINTTIAVVANSAADSGQSSSASTSQTDTRESTGMQSSTASAHYSFVPAQNDTSVKFSVSAGRDRLGSTKQEMVFKAVLNTNDPNTSYLWNFGDGSIGEGRDSTHAYALAGEYTVVLNAVLFDNEAISKTRVQVVDPEISIAEATSEYVAIHNQSKYEINLYGWQLGNGAQTFTFPKDTLIGAGETVKFPTSITKLSEKNIVLSRIADTKPEKISVESFEESTTTATTTEVLQNTEEIQALADKLVALNLELFYTSQPKVQEEIASMPQADEVAEVLPAAAVMAAPSSTWFTTLKHFFGSR